MSKLRRALGDSASTPRYIETARNRGFRLLLPVLNGNANAASAPAVEAPAMTAEPRHGVRWMAWPRAIGAAAVLLALVAVIAWRGGLWLKSSPAPVHSLAVLPFRTMTGEDESWGALSLGIADTLITNLSHLRQIAVRPTSAVRKYAGTETGALDAGRALKVDAVLEGNMQDVGGKIRVNVQLVRVPEGRAIWADRFDETASGLFDLQDRIARRVAVALASELTATERLGIEKRYTSSTAAYQAYRKGRYLWSLRSAGSLERSIVFFEEAIALDPNYALAYSGAADSYLLAYLYNPVKRREWIERAKAALGNALSLDPQLAQAHTTAAAITFQYDWDWAAAERSFLHAIELNPNYSTAHQWYAELLFYTGRFQEAAVEIRRAHDLDPQSVLINLQLASPLLYNRQWREAIAVASESRKLDPSFPLTSYVLGTAYTELGEFDKSFAEFQRIQDTALGLTGLGYAYGRAGDIGRARQVLSKMLALAERDEASPYQVACVYANLGLKSEAMQWLNRARSERDERIVVLKVDPKLDPLRGDARFRELLKSVGL